MLRNTGVRIAWEAVGAGEPLLLLPGLGGSRAMWTAVRERLQEDHRIIAIDPRGAGESDKPAGPYRGADLAEDARDVLDAAGVERAHVAGLSMGGMIAQELALAHPERVASLMLVSTFAAADTWARRCFELRRSLLDELGIAEQLRLATLLVASPGTMERHPEVFAAGPHNSDHWLPDAAGYRAQLEFCLAHDTRGRLGRLAVPTLVVEGAEDLLTTPTAARALAGEIPGAEYVELPGASHSLIWERPEELAQMVSRLVVQANRATVPT